MLVCFVFVVVVTVIVLFLLAKVYFTGNRVISTDRKLQAEVLYRSWTLLSIRKSAIPAENFDVFISRFQRGDIMTIILTCIDIRLRKSKHYH